jgi:hypothetical protein
MSNAKKPAKPAKAPEMKAKIKVKGTPAQVKSALGKIGKK